MVFPGGRQQPFIYQYIPSFSVVKKPRPHQLDQINNVLDQNASESQGCGTLQRRATASSRIKMTMLTRGTVTRKPHGRLHHVQALRAFSQAMDMELPVRISRRRLSLEKTCVICVRTVDQSAQI